jgi:two-component system, LuxR family, response regulator FixJ
MIVQRSIYPPTALLVDDDPAVLRSLAFALELEGFDVRAYSRGIDLLEANDFPENGCLIVDYKMPGLNGLELLGRLRDIGVELPAVLIAGFVTPAIERGAASVGARVMNKPFSVHELTKAVGSLEGCPAL